MCCPYRLFTFGSLVSRGESSSPAAGSPPPFTILPARSLKALGSGWRRDDADRPRRQIFWLGPIERAGTANPPAARRHAGRLPGQGALAEHRVRTHCIARVYGLGPADPDSSGSRTRHHAKCIGGVGSRHPVPSRTAPAYRRKKLSGSGRRFPEHCPTRLHLPTCRTVAARTRIPEPPLPLNRLCAPATVSPGLRRREDTAGGPFAAAAEPVLEWLIPSSAPRTGALAGRGAAQSSRFRKRRALMPTMTTPNTASAAAWGHNTSMPTPLRNRPRTIVMK